MNPNDYIRSRYFGSMEGMDVSQLVDYFYSTKRVLSQKEIRRNLKDMKKQEKPFVLEFLRTGVPDSRVVFALKSLNDNTLIVMGKRMPVKPRGKKYNVLFYMKDGKITANQDRVNQIRKDLERFAVLQGFEIEFTDSILSADTYNTQKVLLYRWTKREEIDDSKLLVTTVNTNPIVNVDDEDDVDDYFPF